MAAISTGAQINKTTQEQVKPKFIRIEEKKFESVCTKALVVVIAFLVIAVAVGGIIGYNLAKGKYTYLPYTSTELYYISKGDTLWSIAEDISDGRYDIRRVVRELQELNDMNSAQIYAYEYLTVPVFTVDFAEESPEELEA